jgi:ATP synthase protein I
MHRGWYEYAKYGSMGISLVLTTSLYLYLGYVGGRWLDRRLHAEPWFFICGLLLALALSLRSLVAQVSALLAELEASAASTRGGKTALRQDAAPSRKDGAPPHTAAQKGKARENGKP